MNGNIFLTKAQKHESTQVATSSDLFDVFFPFEKYKIQMKIFFSRIFAESLISTIF